MSAILPSASVDEPLVVPWEIWAFGWTFVAQGAFQLLAHGPKDDAVSLIGSMLLSALVVPLVAHGVLRARGVRTVIVVFVVGLTLLVSLLGTLVDPSDAGIVGVVGAVCAALQGWLLWRYTRTSWWAWQRTRPAGGPSLVPVLAVAALAGLVGGLAATPTVAEARIDVRVDGAHGR